MADEKEKLDPQKVTSDPAHTMTISDPEIAEKEKADRAERVKALIAGYELAFQHNAPRTLAELNEIRALLA